MSKLRTVNLESLASTVVAAMSFMPSNDVAGVAIDLTTGRLLVGGRIDLLLDSEEFSETLRGLPAHLASQFPDAGVALAVFGTLEEAESVQSLMKDCGDELHVILACTESAIWVDSDEGFRKVSDSPVTESPYLTEFIARQEATTLTFADCVAQHRPADNSDAMLAELASWVDLVEGDEPPRSGFPADVVLSLAESDPAGVRSLPDHTVAMLGVTLADPTYYTPLLREVTGDNACEVAEVLRRVAQRLPAISVANVLGVAAIAYWVAGKGTMVSVAVHTIREDGYHFPLTAELADKLRGSLIHPSEWESIRQRAF